MCIYAIWSSYVKAPFTQCNFLRDVQQSLWSWIALRDMCSESPFRALMTKDSLQLNDMICSDSNSNLGPISLMTRYDTVRYDAIRTRILQLFCLN